MPPTIDPFPGAPSSAARSSFNEDSEICNFASYAFGSVEISRLVCRTSLAVLCGGCWGLGGSPFPTDAEKIRQQANRRVFMTFSFRGLSLYPFGLFPSRL